MNSLFRFAGIAGFCGYCPIPRVKFRRPYAKIYIGAETKPANTRNTRGAITTQGDPR